MSACKEKLFSLITCLLILLLHLSTCYADDCSTIDYSYRAGKVKNQYDTGWCVDFSVSDLATFLYGNEISPYPIALNSLGTINDDTLNYPQSASEAFFISNIRGFCTEKQVALLKPKISTSISIIKSLKGLQMQLLNLRESIISCHYSEINRSENKNLNKTMQKVRSQLDRTAFSELFPEKTINDVIEIMHHPSLVVMPEEILTLLAGQNCKIKFPYVLTSIKSSTTQGTNPVKIFNEQLENGLIASIGFNLFPFVDIEAMKTANYPHDELEEIKREKFIGHKMTLVGRRYSHLKHRCEYVFKNSWGKNCKAEKYKFFPQLACEKGFVYLSKDQVICSTFNIDVLTKELDNHSN